MLGKLDKAALGQTVKQVDRHSGEERLRVEGVHVEQPRLCLVDLLFSDHVDHSPFACNSGAQ